METHTSYQRKGNCIIKITAFVRSREHYEFNILEFQVFFVLSTDSGGDSWISRKAEVVPTSSAICSGFTHTRTHTRKMFWGLGFLGWGVLLCWFVFFIALLAVLVFGFHFGFWFGVSHLCLFLTQAKHPWKKELSGLAQSKQKLYRGLRRQQSSKSGPHYGVGLHFKLPFKKKKIQV